MVLPADATVTLVCEHGDRAVVDAVAIGRSQLIETLPSPPPEEIPVPFSHREVATWHIFSGEVCTKTFADCISALKVADFLQDEATATIAAKAANACLLAPSRKRELSADEPKKPSADTLCCLNPHFLHSVLRAGGQLEDWLRVLPASCIPVAVSAAVQAHSLALNLDSDSMIEDIVAAVRSLSVPVLSLTVVFKCWLYKEPAACQIPAALTQLQSLTLTNMDSPAVPSSLTALTRLRIDHSCTIVSPYRASITTTDVGAFRSLKELSILELAFSDFRKFAKQLPTLTALTCLEFSLPASEEQQELLVGNESSGFTGALSACTALVSLTLGIVETDGMRAYITSPYTLSGQIIDALAALSLLTFLSFAGHNDMAIERHRLELLWPRMPQLVHLSISSIFRWKDYIHTVRLLTQLQRFHLCTGHGQIESGQLGRQSLPGSLTSLELNCQLDELPPLGHLTNLRSIHLKHCFFEQDTHVASLAALTSLQSFTAGGFCSQYFFPVHQTSLSAFTSLLRALPTCVTELCLTNHILPVGAVPVLATLTALQHLDIGTVQSDVMLQSLASHMPSLSELRKFTVKCGHWISLPACGEVLRSLRALPHFEAVNADAEDEDEGLWSMEY